MGASLANRGLAPNQRFQRTVLALRARPAPVWAVAACGSSPHLPVYHREMSPTIFRAGPFRFYFFSREETRMHVHVHSPSGEAKFWLEPRIELAKNYGLNGRQITTVRQ